MTSSEEIRRALDKLLHVNTYVELWVEVDDQWTDDRADLKHEIAALIRSADALGSEVQCPGQPDCICTEINATADALLALVRAINREQT